MPPQGASATAFARRYLRPTPYFLAINTPHFKSPIANANPTLQLVAAAGQRRNQLRNEAPNTRKHHTPHV